jgi:DNA-binding transcriptional ArsR family regulator
MDDVQAAADLARAMGDHTRLTMLQRLLQGPTAVAELVALTGASQPNVSNHLAVLRERGFVELDREGRKVTYRIADRAVARFVRSFLSFGQSPGGGAITRAYLAPMAVARTCYDHLAGAVGVAIFDALIETGAVSRPKGERGEVRLRSPGVQLFKRMGVDLEWAAAARRRFAYACLDWNERRSHLGGALGAALRDRLLEAGWIELDEEPRVVNVTTTGRAALRRHLGLGVTTWWRA